VKYLLDTCVLSEMVKSVPDSKVVKWFEACNVHQLYTSVMTLAELQRGVARLPESKRRTELALWLQELEIGFENRILVFDTNVAKAWVEITVAAEAQGKSLAAFDSLIAATARAHDCLLVTRNVRDFSNASIEILNPWL
jgi:predicted nucleic acid-binding protein